MNKWEGRLISTLGFIIYIISLPLLALVMIVIKIYTIIADSHDWNLWMFY